MSPIGTVAVTGEADAFAYSEATIAIATKAPRSNAAASEAPCRSGGCLVDESADLLPKVDSIRILPG